MHFKFEQLCPHVFQNVVLNSSIWNKDVVITKDERILIHAISGSGKTSFIHYLLGLRNDYSGSILIDGKNINSIDMEAFTEIRRKGISTVFQDLQLFDDLTVKENIAILPEFAFGYDLENAHKMLEDLDIIEKWEQKVSKLSFGQKQRVAIIRALMKPFDFLICDEPFSHLDKLNTMKCTVLIEKRLKEEQAGLILLGLEEECSFTDIKTLQL